MFFIVTELTTCHKELTISIQIKNLYTTGVKVKVLALKLKLNLVASLFFF